MTSPVERLYQWLDTRLDLESYRRFAENKWVPMHHQSAWYYMGGIVLILLLIQVLTGLLLMVYYVPEIKSAYTSILKINSQIDFGWFIRSLHSWGANLMILALFLHMFSTYFMKAYRPPREITWLTGLVLLLISVGFGFTGYLLPWNEVSFFATKIGVDITAQTPVIGETLAFLLRGGLDLNQNTLSRFFAIHVILLPLATLPVLGLHIWLVQLHGMSEPESLQKLPPEKRSYEKFSPTFVLKDVMVWILVVNVLAILVSLYPWDVGIEANPFAPAPIGIKPEWYFLAMFQVLKLIPPYVLFLEGEQFGILLFTLLGLLFALIPFWDRGISALRAKLATGFGWVILVLFIVFTIWGWVS